MTDHRDARTGQFVTAEHAADHPDTTIAEDNTRARELAAERDALLARMAEANPDAAERDQLRAVVAEVRAYCEATLKDPAFGITEAHAAYATGRDAMAEALLDMLPDPPTTDLCCMPTVLKPCPFDGCTTEGHHYHNRSTGQALRCPTSPDCNDPGPRIDPNRRDIGCYTTAGSIGAVEGGTAEAAQLAAVRNYARLVLDMAGRFAPAPFPFDSREAGRREVARDVLELIGDGRG